MSRPSVSSVAWMKHIGTHLLSSTSEGLITVGGAVVNFWSSTQATIAISRSEAAYYASVKAAAEGLGLQARGLKLKMWADFSAADALAGRSGLGKSRHLELKFLWLQEAVKVGSVTVAKVWTDKSSGRVNVAAERGGDGPSLELSRRRRHHADQGPAIIDPMGQSVVSAVVFLFFPQLFACVALLSPVGEPALGAGLEGAYRKGSAPIRRATHAASCISRSIQTALCFGLGPPAS